MELIFQDASALPDCDANQAVTAARQALQVLSAEVGDHEESPDDDVMWRGVHQRVVEVGAAFLRLLERVPRDAEERRVVAFEVEKSAPSRLGAHVGGELWTLLTDYYLRQAEAGPDYARRSSAFAVTSLAVDELIAIDNIDPSDVYDDYENDQY